MAQSIIELSGLTKRYGSFTAVDHLDLTIEMGFDVINSEQKKGTLSRLLSQPIYRDYIINAKCMGALGVISIMFFALGFLVMGFGLIFIGIPSTAEKFMRIILFLLISVVYVALWLNLGIFFR